nr:hypothetical protein GCM10025699_35690 [Microbacterium flavescens]
MTVDVRVEGARAPMLQLDDFDAVDFLTDEPAVPAPRVELRLPREQDAVTEPVLEGFELGGELGMQQRGDAVGLRVVERSVEQQVGVGAQPLMAALFAGDRVVSGEPDTKTPAVSSSEVMTPFATMNRETVESEAALYASSASTLGECCRCASQVPSNA